MTLAERAQGMILRPKETWLKVAAEPETEQSLYSGYIAELAAIGPIAAFIGTSLIGVSLFGYAVRTPVGSGIVSAVVSYVLALVGVFVAAIIASELAPSFGGEKSRLSGLKLCAYASTPVWVVSIVSIIPALGIITLLAALYSLYVLYLGVTPTMKVPAEKSAVYTIVLIVVEIVIFIVIGAIVGALRTAAFMGTGM